MTVTWERRERKLTLYNAAGLSMPSFWFMEDKAGTYKPIFETRRPSTDDIPKSDESEQPQQQEEDQVQVLMHKFLPDYRTCLNLLKSSVVKIALLPHLLLAKVCLHLACSRQVKNNIQLTLKLGWEQTTVATVDIPETPEKSKSSPSSPVAGPLPVAPACHSPSAQPSGAQEASPKPSSWAKVRAYHRIVG